MSARSLRITAACVAALMAASAVPSFAADSRIVTRRFNAEEVVAINGRSGVQASIVLAEDEHIENVAIGDSTSWQVTPNKRANVLFVKPLSAKAQTNMTVISDRRTYYFDLLAGRSANPLYVLRFTYPDEPKMASAAPLAGPAMTETEALAVAGKVQEATVDPARLNFGWQTSGKSGLLPMRVYDDGQSTFLSWDARSAIPAIQVRNEAGVEGPVNFAVRDDVVVIDGVPALIVLRSGKNVATLQRLARTVMRAAPTVPVALPAVPVASPATRLSPSVPALLDGPAGNPQTTALAAVPAAAAGKEP